MGLGLVGGTLTGAGGTAARGPEEKPAQDAHPQALLLAWRQWGSQPLTPWELSFRSRCWTQERWIGKTEV